MREPEPLDPPPPPDGPPLGDAERELAGALARLRPTPPARTSPRQIWYQAGFEAGRRRAGAWRAATGVAVAAGLLALVWGPRRVEPPGVVDRVVYVERAPDKPAGAAAARPPAADVSPPEWSTRYARLRDALAQQGLDALPSSIRGGGGRDPRPGTADWPLGPAGDPLRPTTPWNPANEKG